MSKHTNIVVHFGLGPAHFCNRVVVGLGLIRGGLVSSNEVIVPSQVLVGVVMVCVTVLRACVLPASEKIIQKLP